MRLPGGRVDREQEKKRGASDVVGKEDLRGPDRRSGLDGAVGPGGLTEDDGLAALVRAMTSEGTRNGGSPELAVAALLLAFLPPDVLRTPETAVSAATDAARLAMEGLPSPAGFDKPSGFPEGGSVLDASDAVDLAPSLKRGFLGAGRFAREMVLRARYAAGAVKRLAKARKETGDPEAGTTREAAYKKAHLNAQEHREGATRTLDEAVRRWGKVLSWNCRLDGRETPECRWAHRKNFVVDHPPKIGLPGLGPHGN